MNKIVLAGRACVGKTCICHRLCGLDPAVDRSTVGAMRFETSQLDSNQNPIPLTVWDTAGQETYLSLLPLYFRNARFILLVFSLADPSSFATLDTWRQQARDTTTASIILIGNKSDLAPDFPLAESEDYAKKIDAVGHFIVSAQTGEGFDELLNFILENIAGAPVEPRDGDTNVGPPQKEEGGACCG
jgi:small GTP-binding protein